MLKFNFKLLAFGFQPSAFSIVKLGTNWDQPGLYNFFLIGTNTPTNTLTNISGYKGSTLPKRAACAVCNEDNNSKFRTYGL